MYCPHRRASQGTDSCASCAFPDADLARNVPPEVFGVYTKGRLELLEQRMAMELEADMEARVAAEFERLGKLDEDQRAVLEARKHVD